MKTIEMNVKVEADRITFDNGGDEWFHLTRDGETVIADSFCAVVITPAAQESLVEWLSKPAPKARSKKR